jgi:hypothetical protein
MARATRHNLDQRILESWHRHEAAEPDISTERLMAMVRDGTGAEPDRQVEALQRAGCCAGTEWDERTRTGDVGVFGVPAGSHAGAAHVAKRVDHRVEHLVIDRDRCSQVLRLNTRRGDAGSDSLTDIAYLVGCQRRPSW